MKSTCLPARTRRLVVLPALALLAMTQIGLLLSLARSSHGVLAAATEDPCASLLSLRLPDTTITRAARVAAGMFVPPGSIQAPPADAGITPVPFKDLPEFCWVSAIVQPTNDSEIGFDLWIPASSWNHKFIGIGNGGFGGLIPYATMSSPLARGYATASTDTGHQWTGQQTMRFVLGHPEKLIDFGFRAVHEMTVKAKQVIAAYYGQAPRLSYWSGCSTGGRQGLMEAQRFPADYDGIVAGNPVSAFTHLQAAHLMKRLALDKNPAGFLPPPKLALLHDAVLKQCDANDGVVDRVLEDPRDCRFDPETLACSGEDHSDCLTAPQIDVVRTFYSPTMNPRTNAEIFPPLERGSELGWSVGVGHMVAQRPRGPGDYLQFAIFQDPDWDYKTFDFDADVARADRIDHGIVAAVDPNLAPFIRRGGKLLQYHGWSDQSVAPRASINYYMTAVASSSGIGNVHDAYRLFMVPGMFHCGGGDGPNIFDSIATLEQWVEERKTPERIVAAHSTDGKADRSRPLCRFPNIAVYKGVGSTNDTANFVCRRR
jgi:feruloyl esterase